MYNQFTINIHPSIDKTRVCESLGNDMYYNIVHPFLNMDFVIGCPVKVFSSFSLNKRSRSQNKVRLQETLVLLTPQPLQGLLRHRKNL